MSVRPFHLILGLSALLVEFFVKGQLCKDITTANRSLHRKHLGARYATINYGNAADYQIIKMLGAGTFGEAFLATSVKFSKPVVIKVFYEWMRHSHIVREILIMQSLCGGPNILKLVDVVKKGISERPALVVEYVNAADPAILYPSLNGSDIKYYARELLLAIEYMHGHKIIHRDIKPSNILIDPFQRVLRLIDFGISHFHFNGALHTDFGTYCYQAPEALFEYYHYDMKADIWSFGVVLAGLIFREEYFFPGDTPDEQLEHYSKTLGTQGLINLVEKYYIPCNRSISAFIDRPRVSWNEFVNDKNRHLVDDEAIEVLNATFRYDPVYRASARELLQFRYFRS